MAGAEIVSKFPVVIAAPRECEDPTAVKAAISEVALVAVAVRERHDSMTVRTTLA
jgi:hypothetical protein